MSQSTLTTKRSFLVACAAAACTAGFALPSAALEMAKYPEREVTMIINYGAGGNTDVAARAIGNAMEGLLKKPVVPNNRGGAQGTLGVSSLAKQKPDGYTLGIVTFSTIAITPHLMNVDYTVDNFDFIAGVARYRYGVAVRADSPYKTMQDLIAAAKKDKGVFFGAPSAPNNIAMFELGRKSGGKFEQVSYKSGAETVSALLGGHVDVIVQNPSDIVPHVKAGKMRLLASASPMRWKELPEVPTLKEQGFDVEIDSWIGLAFPKGTPAAIRERMEKVAMAAAASPQLAPILETAGVDPAALTGAEYRSKLIEGRDAMAIAIKAANLPRMN